MTSSARGYSCSSSGSVIHYYEQQLASGLHYHALLVRALCGQEQVVHRDHWDKQNEAAVTCACCRLALLNRTIVRWGLGDFSDI